MEDSTKAILVGGCTLLIFIVFVVYIVSIHRRSSRCSNALMNGAIRSLPAEKAKHPLSRYYIQTAYNACCGGAYAYDTVDLCHLKAVLRQGVRCIDLEVFSIDGQPHIAATNQVQDGAVLKTTLNSLPFADVLDTIVVNAFSFDGCPNPKDPLLLHLRIKTHRGDQIYPVMAAACRRHMSKLLGNGFDYDQAKVLHTPVESLSGKLILIVDANDFHRSELAEFVNLVSRSANMRWYPYQRLQKTADQQELLQFNQNHLTLVTPNEGETDPANPDIQFCHSLGCSMVAMRYSLKESKATEPFVQATCAFVEKPEFLV